MLSILTRALLLVTIIFLGYGLRRIHFFDEHAFPVLSKLILNVTLPCAVITNFSSMELEVSMLSLFLIGFAACGLLVLSGYLSALRRSTNDKVMCMINYAGFNIGCFVMPFISSFLGPAAIVSVCMFDVGNAIWCVGITNAVCASMQNGGRIDPRYLLKRVTKSFSTMVYVVMMILGLLHIRLPGVVLEFASIVAPANTALAMFMLGLGMNLNFRREHFRWIGRAFITRFGITALLAVLLYLVLPFEQELRLGLALVLLGPVSSAAPAFTHERGCDYGLAASWNTLSILTSITLMTGVMLFTAA